jgi:putative ABC transport system substrate-binding protein
MSLDINAFEMGRQAGEFAANILSGKKVADLSPVEADTANLIINESVAGKLKVPLDKDLRDKARLLR